MNKRRFWLSLFLFCAFSIPAHADYKSANRQTVLNDTTDFFATLGTSGRDKQEILKERRDLRREARLQDEERRKRAQTRKRMKQQQDAMMRKINAS
jgi:hypothetical protein